MSIEEFQKQMVRLSDQFGKGAYSQSRAELMWREVRDFSVSWWIRTVDRMISEHRMAPLLPDIREMIAEERERLWRIEKQKHAKDAKEFWEGTYQPDDVKQICSEIKRRLSKQMNDEDFKNFSQILSNTKLTKVRTSCVACEDCGLVFAKEDGEMSGYVFRCSCESGRKRNENYEIWI